MFYEPVEINTKATPYLQTKVAFTGAQDNRKQLPLCALDAHQLNSSLLQSLKGAPARK